MDIIQVNGYNLHQTSFLICFQKQLDNRGLKYARIDGTMNPTRRDAAIYALEHDPDCSIMLASLAVCSVGLNLVAVCDIIGYIYLLTPLGKSSHPRRQLVGKYS